MSTASKVLLCALMVAALSACESTGSFESSTSADDSGSSRMGLYDARRYMEDDALPPTFTKPYTGQGSSYQFSTPGYGQGIDSTPVFSGPFFRQGLMGP